MAKKIFSGVGVALITPFDKSGKVDVEGLRKLVNHLINRGADFLTILGTTAETPTLTSQEKELVVTTVVKENNERLPLLLGLGGNCTDNVVAELKSCPYIKYCQGVLSVVPFYNKPSQQGIYEHFKAIAEASPIPVVLYNVPGRTGLNMQAETTIKLANNFSNIIGIKEAAGIMQQATDLLKIQREDFSILSGEDALVMPLVAMGFDGVISVAANQYPHLYKEMISDIVNGDIKKAAKIHVSLSDYCKAIFKEGNPAGIKSALYTSGLIDSQTLRLPLTTVSDKLSDALRELCAQLN